MGSTKSSLPDLEHSSQDESIDYVKKRCYEHNDTFSSVLDHSPTNETDVGLTCSRIFDGYCCWDETPAGETAYQQCPSYIANFNSSKEVFKECLENGTWNINPDDTLTSTNYTTCLNVEQNQGLSVVNQIYVYGYAISAITLLISLGIFAYFRAFRFTRIRIHVHLFGSFIVNNLAWIICFKTVVNNFEVIHANGVFLDDYLVMKYLVMIGWVAPIFIIGFYTIVRFFITGPTDSCWMGYSEALWVLIVPILLSLSMSFGILINVVRVVVTKLRPTPNQSIYTATRRAIRTALVLIPLFGIHFIIIPIRPPSETNGEQFFHILWALLTSLQGVCLSILYCFTDSEVIAAIKLYYARVTSHNDDFEMTGVTGDQDVNSRGNSDPSLRKLKWTQHILLHLKKTCVKL